MESVVLQHLGAVLEERCSRPLGKLRFQPVAGGCINRTGFIVDSSGDFRAFLKVAEAASPSHFEAELQGLEEIERTRTIRVPHPLLVGTVGTCAFLVLEALDLAAPVDGRAAERLLGHQLAALHRVHGEAFGWRRDNVIGGTPQINTREDDWVTFFGQHRLRYQMELAAQNGLCLSRGNELLDRLDHFFVGYEPKPSLLHGDLWTGNLAFDEKGAPVLYDPAVYYGDRETDLAFTEMFGGLGAGFYRAYDEVSPLDPGYGKRRHLYNLYHILNHYNLFAGHYGRRAQDVISRLLR